LLAVMDAERVPDELRQNRRPARPRLHDFFLVLGVHGFHLLHQVVIHKRPFMYGTSHVILPRLSLLLLPRHDPLIRALVIASLETARRLAPRSHRMTAAAGFAFAA